MLNGDYQEIPFVDKANLYNTSESSTVPYKNYRFATTFSDGPGLKEKVTEGGTVFPIEYSYPPDFHVFIAELSLVKKNEGGGYSPIATFSWGVVLPPLKYTNQKADPGSLLPLKMITNPSLFHLNSIPKK